MSERNIGNYKGVMLCNRPNQEPFPSSKPVRFVSRVNPSEPLGVTLPPKEINREYKPRPKSILVRHRKWLALVQERRAQIDKEKEDKLVNEEKKKEQFAKNMQKQRQKIVGARDSENKTENFEQKKKVIENFDRPKWALTAQENEQAEENEVDQLLNFVENLDYDKYVEDLEFKMALEIVKNKVQDIVKKHPQIEKRPQSAQSARSVQSAQSAQSVQSVAPSVAESAVSKKSEAKTVEHEQDWDDHRNRKMNTMAKKIADNILKEFPFLKNVHSNASIRQLMEKNIDDATIAQHPTIAIVKERLCARDVGDPSNLPYLHRNPAV